MTQKHKDFLESREIEKRRDYANYLMYTWNAWQEVKPIDNDAMQIIRQATEKNPADYRKDILYHNSWLTDIDNHRFLTAYKIITAQPLDFRKTNVPKLENNILAWRIVQVILFLVLFFGINPADWSDGALSRGWIQFLFIAFTIATALCGFYTRAYKQYQRETSVLNAIVNEADIAAYLRTPACAKAMQEQRNQPDCSYTYELDEYLIWYETKGIHQLHTRTTLKQP